jgi:hypothetical protein
MLVRSVAIALAPGGERGSGLRTRVLIRGEGWPLRTFLTGDPIALTDRTGKAELGATTLCPRRHSRSSS